MKPGSFTYHAPRTVDEAVALLGSVAANDGRVIAGGQSLVPTMALRLAQPAHLIDINGVSGLCVMKLDVMDGMETVQLGVGYRMSGQKQDILPFGAEMLAECEPIYDEMPGWSDSTVGITGYDKLPANARAYLKRMEEVCGVPIDIISTGPDRDETIVLRHPYDA